MTIEIYVSTDIEADVPIPGLHSMLSIGSAAYTVDKQLIATFSANLETLPGAAGHPKTMQWWSKQPEAWEACRINPQPPASVMQAYYTWLTALPGKPIFVAYPAAPNCLLLKQAVQILSHILLWQERSHFLRTYAKIRKKLNLS
ncbi:3'-5' exoribonuclease [Nostoc spongiaeforme]|uniref:3'-5' exoribonuclease n=1 Tax=Nostoc spongiaeforme TaxID=502487 RepID=UPI001F54B01D|nr:3'-5' exoribonuclease [Nostoc spongiaeforme]